MIRIKFKSAPTELRATVELRHTGLRQSDLAEELCVQLQMEMFYIAYIREAKSIGSHDRCVSVEGVLAEMWQVFASR
jgi:hypothetical protein